MTQDRRTKTAYWLILTGACVFILMLAVSAYWEPEIRWLHVFQALMYIATIALAHRKSRWGYFIGISTAGLWVYANIFATTFFFNGLQQLSQWVHAGHLSRPDLLIAVPAWFSNLIVVARFVVTCALTTGFFALDMFLFQPRYLGLFPRMLHPHLP